ncbi:MAG: hypothetical protein LBH38_04280, partial [Holosporales bacterium]|nr:hypothetical protein [Holosporales bacterium]
LLLVGLFTFLKGILDKKHRWPLVVYAALSIVVTDLAERSHSSFLSCLYDPTLIQLSFLPGN